MNGINVRRRDTTNFFVAHATKARSCSANSSRSRRSSAPRCRNAGARNPSQRGKMTPPSSEQFVKCAAHGDDRRARNEHRCQRDVLARQTGSLPRSVDIWEIRSGVKPSHSHRIRRSRRAFGSSLSAEDTDGLPAIRQAGHFYAPAKSATTVADPDDEMFVECAVASRADYLVTGDQGRFEGRIRHSIIAASGFLRSLGVPENPTLFSSMTRLDQTARAKSQKLWRLAHKCCFISRFAHGMFPGANRRTKN